MGASGGLQGQHSEGLDMFGVFIGEGDTLKQGALYTFTFVHGRIFEYRSDDWVFMKIKDYMTPYAETLSVNRPFFSDRYLVVLRPKSNYSFSDFLNLMMGAWDKMGYGRVEFLAAETDAGSTYPGGLPGIAKEVTTGIQESVIAGVQPLIPLVIIGGLIWLGLKIKR